MRIGILCSIPQELNRFNLIKNSAQNIGGKTFFMSHNPIHELIVVECGLGKVNAAYVSSLLIQKFKCKLLFFSGIAGGIDPEIKIGEVVVGESIIQHDYGSLQNGILKVYRAGKIPIGSSKYDKGFELDSKIRNLIELKLPNLRMGKILTGDVYIQCNEMRNILFEKFGAQAVEMEGGAVAQVAEQFKIPVIVVRCISDLAGANKLNSSTKFIPQAAENSYNAVKDILKVLI